jgi:hypothetical protein
MNYNAYYHILLINNWRQIVREQLSLMMRSGLYDKLSTIRIGALGPDIEELQELLQDYPKCEIVRYSPDIQKYEFWTLKILHHDALEDKPFYAVYFHTKGVSFPYPPYSIGGKHWRDYMNHYNLKEWNEPVKMLRKGFDTCGVKLLTEKDPPARKLHYSGNFFWCKSSYVKRLVDPETMDQRDRFNAEFWIGTGKPQTACLCDDFVDYNTKGCFHEGTNYVHTLAYNLPSETEKAVNLLYSQNENFKHYIVDLGFPIASDKLIDIEKAKKINTSKLKGIAQKYGSEYVKFENIGVSQNWDQVFKYLKLKDEDVLIGADPDEHPQNEGWVNAMGDVLRSGPGLVSLMMLDHVNILKKYKPKNIDGHRCLVNPGQVNWALIGLSGWFLNQMGTVPHPPNAKRYGWIEWAIRQEMNKYKVDWACLMDFKVRHTDFELDDPGTSEVLREWKNLIIFQIKKYGQISLEEYIERKLKGEFNV